MLLVISEYHNNNTFLDCLCALFMKPISVIQIILFLTPYLIYTNVNITYWLSLWNTVNYDSSSYFTVLLLRKQLHERTKILPGYSVFNKWTGQFEILPILYLYVHLCYIYMPWPIQSCETSTIKSLAARHGWLDITMQWSLCLHYPGCHDCLTQTWPLTTDNTLN